MNIVKIEVELGLKEYEAGDIFIHKGNPNSAYILCRCFDSWALISLDTGKVLYSSNNEHFQPLVELHLSYLGSCNIQITKRYTTEQ